MTYSEWKAEIVKCAALKSVHQEFTQLVHPVFSVQILNKAVGMKDSLALFMQQGEICIEIDKRPYRMTGMAVLIVLPRQQLNIISASPDFDGIICLISIPFFNLFEIKNAAQTYMSILRKPCYAVGEENMKKIVSYSHAMFRAMNQLENPYRKDVVKHLMKARFYELHYLFVQDTEAREDGAPQIFGSFLHQLQEGNYDWENYARTIGISSKYLNDSIRLWSGKSAVKWVEEYKIFRAKTLLESKGQNVKQISLELGFSSPAVFARFFKRVVGVSPTDYREQFPDSSNVQ